MALLISSTYPAPSTTLTVADQPLAAQPLSSETVQTLQAAAAGPAAIYHPSEEAQHLGATMEAVETWIGRPQAADYPQKAAAQKVALDTLKVAFQSLTSSLPPDLAGKKFGFSVQADGTLKASNTSGQLSTQDLARLNSLLNANGDLVDAATAFRDTSIDVVEASGPLSEAGLGGYSLTKDNFGKTIDLAALFTPKGPVPTKEYVQGMFFSQLYAKGERMTPEMEIALMASRDAAQS
ncbi:hypothetical protein [Pseudomonas sp. TE3610]